MRMPLREVAAKFTRSELTIYAWRSQEQYWQMKERMARHGTPVEEEEEEEPYEETGDEDLDRIYDQLDRNHNVDRKKELRRKKRIKKKATGKTPSNLPDKFYNKEGEVDLRLVTGDEALKYFAKLGMPLPVARRMT